MEKQFIITIGREFGSGGYLIGEKLAKHFGVKIYDANILEEIAAERGLNPEELKAATEKPVSKFMRRTVRGMSMSFQENVAQFEFDFLRKKASEGESFILIGRCGDHVFKDRDDVVSVFVWGSVKNRIARVVDDYGVPMNEAGDLIKKVDKNRRTYHDYYAEGKWGASTTYDICVNSDEFDTDEITKLLVEHIEKKFKG